MKERLLYIDRLKGFTIYLVVIGHLIQHNVSNSCSNGLFNIIYSFHMPLFFFLSGYVSFKTIKIDSIREYFIFIKNKAFALLIPMLIWPLIRKYFFTNATDYNTILADIAREIQYPGLWFLKMLFQILVVYSLFNVLTIYLNKKMKLWIDILLCFIFISFLTLFSLVFKEKAILTFLLNFSFFMIGVLISKYDFIKKIIENKISASIIAITFVLFVGHYNFIQQDTLIMKGLKVIISLTAVSLFYYLTKKITLPLRLDNYICKIGQKSLIIYVTHFSFLSILHTSMLLPPNISLVLLILIIIPLSILLVSFCVGIGKLVSFFPYLNYLFYGVRINKNP